jgi:endonuclease/exonuclease/phosphatase family metal-dependent hydrolase
VISFLFWNLAKNPQTLHSLTRLAGSRVIDVFLLAEAPDDLSSFLRGERGSTGTEYQLLSTLPTKVQLLTRLPADRFLPRFTEGLRGLSIWRLSAAKPERVLLALVHLPAKSGGVQDADQAYWAEAVAREVAEIEDDEQCLNTILVGDLNMNPFDPGMVNVMGLHGLMTRDLARLPDRVHHKQSFRRFYNPMWGFFGDRTPGPAGTFFWDSSAPSNQHWHILDQVLLRPSLVDRLRDLQILDHDGYDSLLKGTTATRDHLSDHLPIFFSLDIEWGGGDERGR